ncbi:chaperone modulator CbpM [Pseudohongiella spirulinae]|uniref:Chaperone modulatory protein CbpM n=1 Tax=Pseudohongiella spirulinae TaxID=1249552 RepID=A0A0S2KHC9_9GAMM|nr:chaperone modulator CbpM [Pseudohongiella spirulinae]ALO47346.1 chaperone modulatory protein CbpM [Pseudohongiella spirulinae]
MELHITIQEVCDSTGLSHETLIEIVEHGIVEPQGQQPEQWLFSGHCLSTLQRARRLQQDLHLNWQGIALILELIEQRDQLKAENSALRNRLQRFDPQQE